MKIVRIRAYRVELPLKELWNLSGNRNLNALDSTIVRIETDDGRSGWGETCPLGPFYMPSYAGGVRAGLRELAPVLIGRDPRAVDGINRAMDRALQGHPYAKSALDIACWDLLGQDAGLPLVTLLGGRDGEAVELYRAISMNPPEAMAAKVREYRDAGIRRFQLKVGGEAATDIQRIWLCAEAAGAGAVVDADANTGWLAHDAHRVVRGVRDLDVYIEQPCAGYEACLEIRRATDHPFVLDESIDSLQALLRLHADGAADAINLKLSRVGGLTRARQIRDLCVRIGLPLTIEDSWGSDIATAAIVHLAHATPEAFRFGVSDFNDYVTVSTAEGAPHRDGAFIAATDAPGLGVRPRLDVLGEPVLEITAEAA